MKKGQARKRAPIEGNKLTFKERFFKLPDKRRRRTTELLNSSNSRIRLLVVVLSAVEWDFFSSRRKRRPIVPQYLNRTKAT